MFSQLPLSPFSRSGALKSKVRNNHSENISKYLLNQIDFTARRMFYEEHEFKNYMLGKDNKQLLRDVTERNCETPAYQDAEIKELNEFRLNNYAECIDQFNRRRRQHKPHNHICVHRYRLNDRLFAEPKVLDEQGRSGCAVCSQMNDFVDKDNVFDSSKYRRYLLLNGKGTANEKGGQYENLFKTPTEKVPNPVIILEMNPSDTNIIMKSTTSMSSLATRGSQKHSKVASINEKGSSAVEIKKRLRKLYEPPSNSLALNFQKRMF
jgi:hypothetical protein